MPAPETIGDFIGFVEKSGLVDLSRLRTYLKQNGNGAVRSPRDMANHMIRDALLTNFQAEQLLQGRYRRFSIGGYKILEPLGTGGMGAVYLCESPNPPYRVAIKVLPPTTAQEPVTLKRFQREARAGSTLDHPNIVRTYDVGQDDKSPYLVMEYVEGSLLKDLVKRFGPLSVDRAAHYIRQAAQGLQHAHEQGLVHRDIKPGNLLLDRSGTVKILDMGLARFFEDEDDVLTRGVLGTADYLAPEQTQDSHTVDIRADIYSLGGAFYFLLAGATPYGKGTVAQKLIWHQKREPRPIREIRPDLPRGLDQVIAMMMAKDPAARYQTPADVVQALAPYTRMPISPPPEQEMPQLSPAARLPGRVAAVPELTPVVMTPPVGVMVVTGGSGSIPPPPPPARSDSATEVGLSSPDTSSDHVPVPRPPAPEPVAIAIPGRTPAPRWKQWVTPVAVGVLIAALIIWWLSNLP